VAENGRSFCVESSMQLKARIVFSAPLGFPRLILVSDFLQFPLFPANSASYR
jgi:hypothetical protein